MAALSIVFAVAQNTFRETIRNRVLHNLFGFAVVMLVLGWVVSNWSLGEPGKIIADIGLSITSLAMVSIALFSGVVLVWGEVEKRTILPILAKPVSRRLFVLGKFCGFTGSVTLVFIGMHLLLFILLGAVGESISGNLIAAAFLAWWEMILIVGLALFFSTFSSPTLSALYTVMIFVAGRFSGDVRLFLDENPLSRSKPLLEVVYVLLPHLDSFNVRMEAVHGMEIESARIMIPSLYGLCYAAVLLAGTVLVFRKRDLA
jgi:ABC-type transport system involved in multi-copper enzyme maturation permease subunit